MPNGNASRSDPLTITVRLDFDDLPNAKSIGMQRSTFVGADQLIRRVIDFKAVDENAAKSGDRSDDPRSANARATTKRLPGPAYAIAFAWLISRSANAGIIRSRLRDRTRSHRKKREGHEKR
jgi:hypothetical protein